jgi:flagellar protein FliS
MTPARRDDYLESRVLTAPPHRLHLLLIEGALRFGRQAEAALRAGDTAAAGPPLMRTVDIVAEMLVGVRAGKSEIKEKLAAFYWFLFRTVSAAKINDDVEKLAEALRLLEYERETWQLVCDKLSDEVPAAAEAAAGGGASPRPTTPLPFAPHAMRTADGSLSLEA